MFSSDCIFRFKVKRSRKIHNTTVRYLTFLFCAMKINALKQNKRPTEANHVAKLLLARNREGLALI